mmetsp:Transcript_126991/g.179207  ORF Transcript_126991/g.179207 Transcript_126991/m.179207 type:complete len:1000 (+) Transcript_126991:70-3069(+)
MSAETQMKQFELKLKKAIERVKLVLEAEKKPQLPVDVHHSYEDKFSLLERGSCLALASLANSLEQLGLGGEKLAQLQTWAAAHAVSLRFKSKETCQFLREVTRDEESPTKRVNEIQVGGVAFGSFTSKTVTKVTEFFWKFDMAYELEAIRGVGADASDRLLICSRSGHVELKTSTKSSPHPETKVSTCEEVNISFLVKQLLGSPATPAFKIDRLSPKCRTPRRNPEVQEAVNFGRRYLTWICKVSKYFERLHRIHPDRSTTPAGSSDLFVPALPLFIKGSAKAGSSASGSESLVLLGEDTEVTKHVVSAADGNRLLGEESRTLGEQRANLMEVFPDDGSIYTWMESFRVLILQHSQQVVVQWSEMIEYVEHMLRMQLVAAIGKEVRPAEFASYMRFHYRKLFREAYQPTPCSFAIRRSTKHGPEGTISIEEEALGLQDESSIKSPICAITAAGRTPSTMTFPLNASTTISFGGQVHLHAWLDHKFSGQSSSKLSLVSRARQFSSFMVLIGRVSSSTTFDPKYAALVQNKDELEIPLELSTIPTPKEFKDAIESLSPEQKEFAKAFRAMQLESTLFAVLVVQIKPQLEKLLNLADDSLTKEIKLTQDLMQLFIKYQIPSDLLSFTSDLLPNGHGSAGERLQVVKGQVKAMHDMIEAEKREELEQRRKEEEYRRLEEEKKRCQEEEVREVQLRLKEVMEIQSECMDQILLRGDEMASPEKFHRTAKKSGGFFGGMGRALSGAVQSLGGSSSKAEKCRSTAPNYEPRSLCLDSAAPRSRRRLSVGAAPTSSKAAVAPPVEPASAEAPEPQASQPSEPSQAEAKPKTTQQPPSQPEAVEESLEARDYTQVPKQLDEQFEKLDPDSSLRPTIINPGSTWSKRSQAALLAAAQTRSLASDEQKREKDAAFDLLDAITKSGALPLSHAELHIIVAATHCFDKTVTETVVQDNVNPIAKVERSSLIMASTVHQQPAECLMNESCHARVVADSPQLFLEDATKAEPAA